MDKRILIGGSALLVIVLTLVFLLKGKRADIETNPAREITAKELYDQAAAFKQDGETVQAKKNYQRILSEHPDFRNIEKVQEELEDLNMQLIFSNTLTPNRSVLHEVKSGDTLGELAKKYGTTIDLIKQSNRITGNVIRVGQKLRIWTGTFNIFVDKSQNLLILKDGDEVLKVYHVSTGSGNITPVGEFKIVSKLVDPVWFNRGIAVPPESPQNVLGSRWLGFDLSGYGIHGTIEPDSIGRQVTAGCIRMYNKDVEELYSIIPRGTQVVVVD